MPGSSLLDLNEAQLLERIRKIKNIAILKNQMWLGKKIIMLVKQGKDSGQTEQEAYNNALTSLSIDPENSLADIIDYSYPSDWLALLHYYALPDFLHYLAQKKLTGRLFMQVVRQIKAQEPQLSDDRVYLKACDTLGIAHETSLSYLIESSSTEVMHKLLLSISLSEVISRLPSIENSLATGALGVLPPDLIRHWVTSLSPMEETVAIDSFEQISALAMTAERLTILPHFMHHVAASKKITYLESICQKKGLAALITLLVNIRQQHNGQDLIAAYLGVLKDLSTPEQSITSTRIKSNSSREDYETLTHSCLNPILDTLERAWRQQAEEGNRPGMSNILKTAQQLDLLPAFLQRQSFSNPSVLETIYSKKLLSYVILELTLDRQARGQGLNAAYLGVLSVFSTQKLPLAARCFDHLWDNSIPSDYENLVTRVINKIPHSNHPSFFQQSPQSMEHATAAQQLARCFKAAVSQHRPPSELIQMIEDAQQLKVLDEFLQQSLSNDMTILAYIKQFYWFGELIHRLAAVDKQAPDESSATVYHRVLTSLQVPRDNETLLQIMAHSEPKDFCVILSYYSAAEIIEQCESFEKQRTKSSLWEQIKPRYPDFKPDIQGETGLIFAVKNRILPYFKKNDLDDSNKAHLENFIQQVKVLAQQDTQALPATAYQLNITLDTFISRWDFFASREPKNYLKAFLGNTPERQQVRAQEFLDMLNTSLPNELNEKQRAAWDFMKEVSTSKAKTSIEKTKKPIPKPGLTEATQEAAEKSCGFKL